MRNFAAEDGVLSLSTENLSRIYDLASSLCMYVYVCTHNLCGGFPVHLRNTLFLAVVAKHMERSAFFPHTFMHEFVFDVE